MEMPSKKESHQRLESLKRHTHYTTGMAATGPEPKNQIFAREHFLPLAEKPKEKQNSTPPKRTASKPPKATRKKDSKNRCAAKPGANPTDPPPTEKRRDTTRPQKQQASFQKNRPQHPRKVNFRQAKIKIYIERKTSKKGNGNCQQRAINPLSERGGPTYKNQ